MVTDTTTIKRTRVKVCGMTQASEVCSLVVLGVDAIGMILHADSPRLATLEQAKAIRDEVPAFVTLVGVFVDCDASKVIDYANDISLDLVQLHGDETNDYANSLGIPYIKAIRAKSKDQVTKQLSDFLDARGILLDPYVANKHGGTGQQLAAESWPDKELVEKHKLILAGGLSPSNIVAAVNSFKPFAVDINSGVEDSPGFKNIGEVAKCLQLLQGL